MGKLLWAIAVAGASGVLAAQMPLLSGANEPLLGFASDQNGIHLHTIVGAASHPRFGATVNPPAGTNKLYLAPRQRYALVGSGMGDRLAVWVVRSGASPAAFGSGVPTNPEAVMFSPAGESAALLSNGRRSVSILTGLPGQPRLLRNIEADGQTFSTLAVSDDGALLVADFGNGMPFYSSGGSTWLALPTSVRLQAAAFFPHTHQLAASDSLRKEVVLWSGVSESRRFSERVLASNVTADRMAVTSDADEVIAASTTGGTVAEIPLMAEGRYRSLRFANISAVTTLRDGHAFLLSSYPALTLIRAAASELHAGR